MHSTAEQCALADAAQVLADQKLLVTGATGFLGRHLARAMADAGCKPVLMLRPETPAPDGYGIVRADLGDPAALAKAVQDTKPDVIFHLAARTTPDRDLANAAPMLDDNFAATVTLAEAAMNERVKRFVFTGTCEEYGRQASPFSEDLPCAPVSPYSASKSAATLWLKMLHETHGFPAVILRPFLVYGPGQAPPKLVPSAMQAALNNQDFDMTSGTQHRELSYVSDVVEGMLRAAVEPRAVGEILNLGSGTEHRVIDLVRKIYALTGGGGKPNPGALPDRANELMHFCANPARAKDILGWQTRTSLDAGLSETLHWMREHGETPYPL